MPAFEQRYKRKIREEKLPRNWSRTDQIPLEMNQWAKGIFPEPLDERIKRRAGLSRKRE